MIVIIAVMIAVTGTVMTTDIPAATIWKKSMNTEIENILFVYYALTIIAKMTDECLPFFSLSTYTFI